ncbi:MAG: Cof-type HAD-IIB family hydrolase [Thermoguttaceae bacterium]|jgi:Cof subfamily protein (haloacid dehalogenase superfamily)
MGRYRLLAIDVDGTLVNSKDELTPATRAALARATRAGLHVVLATGRRYRHTLHLVEPLAISVPLVTASGALVKDPLDHRTLFKAEFDAGVLRAALALVERCGYDALLHADTFAEGFDHYYARNVARNPYIAEYLARNAAWGRLWPDLVAQPPPGIFACMVMGEQPEMLELDQRLHAELPGRLATHVLRSPRYRGFICELAPAGVTKWSAIHRLAAGWGIPQAAICAVGDDVNDIPMIRAAGLGVAMGNALPAVKAAADRIAPTHDDEGLATVVDWLLAEAAAK